MGFYQVKRQEFKDIYGFYPKSDLLNLFIKSDVLCKFHMLNNFYNNPENEQRINFYEKKFIYEYKYRPNKFDLYNFQLLKDHKTFIPSKIIFTLLRFFRSLDYKSRSYDFEILNYYYNFHNSCIKECLKSFLLDIYFKKSARINFISSLVKYEYISYDEKYEIKFLQVSKNTEELYYSNIYFDELYNLLSKKFFYSNSSTIHLLYKYENLRFDELIHSIKTGEYEEDVLKDLFDKNTCFLSDFLYYNNIEYLYLPKSELIKKIKFNSSHNKQIKVYVPSQYYAYSFEGCFIIQLESPKYLCDNINKNKSNNLNELLDIYSKEFENEFGFRPPLKLLDKYLKDKTSFQQQYNNVIEYLYFGKYNNEVIDDIIDFFINGEYDNWFHILLNSLYGNTFYAPPCNVSFDYPLLPNRQSEFKGTIILSDHFKKQTYSAIEKSSYNRYNRNMVKTHYNYNIVVEDPYNNIEKIKGLVGSEYYQKYCEEYIKNNSINELKYLVAPECIKKALGENPNTNEIVIGEHYGSWNNGVNKTYWDDYFEAYYWDTENNYWLHIYEREYGSD